MIPDIVISKALATPDLVRKARLLASELNKVHLELQKTGVNVDYSLDSSQPLILKFSYEIITRVPL